MNLLEKNIAIWDLKAQFFRLALIIQDKLHRPEIEPGLRFRPFQLKLIKMPVRKRGAEAVGGHKFDGKLAFVGAALLQSLPCVRAKKEGS